MPVETKSRIKAAWIGVFGSIAAALIGVFFGHSWSIDKVVGPRKALITKQITTLNAKLEYLDDTPERKEAWKKIWRQLLAVTSNANVKGIIKIPPIISKIGEVEIVLVPQKDTQLDHKYIFVGYGYYHENLIIRDQSAVGMSWTFRIESDPKTEDQLISGTELPITVIQQGYGNSLIYNCKIKTSEGGFLEERVPVTYEGAQIAYAYIKSSTMYGLH